jgi:hypothetical protein
MYYEDEFRSTFYDDARWTLPGPHRLIEATTTGFSDPDSDPADDLGLPYS